MTVSVANDLAGRVSPPVMSVIMGHLVTKPVVLTAMNLDVSRTLGTVSGDVKRVTMAIFVKTLAARTAILSAVIELLGCV